MFHLCNNGKPRTEISEYNGSNIKTIDDNLLPGISRIRNKAKARDGFPAPVRPTMPILSSIEQSYIRNWENDDNDNDNNNNWVNNASYIYHISRLEEVLLTN